MRITYKVFLVGGIPITIAAAIALAAFVLLNEADRARSGAVLAGTIYRNLLSARSSRDDFLETAQSERTRYYELFLTYAEQARFDLMRLSGVVRDDESAAAAQEAIDALQRYRENMRLLVDVTVRNDGLTSEMAERADTLVRLTDEARERQHASNADIVESLAAGDRKLRLERDIVDQANAFDAAVADVALFSPRPNSLARAAESGVGDRFGFEVGRMNSAAARLKESLAAAGLDRAIAEFAPLFDAYAKSVGATPAAKVASEGPRRLLTTWTERLLKVHSTEMGALHDEVAELLT
jgi:hypothetical protein